MDIYKQFKIHYAGLEERKMVLLDRLHFINCYLDKVVDLTKSILLIESEIDEIKNHQKILRKSCKEITGRKLKKLNKLKKRKKK